ncbi:MAG: hypothetical protein U0Z44_12860 [Kouleothrix sp.]
MLASGAGNTINALSFHACGEWGAGDLLIAKTNRIRQDSARMACRIWRCSPPRSRPPAAQPQRLPARLRALEDAPGPTMPRGSSPRRLP